jgi:hypothetical protein
MMNPSGTKFSGNKRNGLQQFLMDSWQQIKRLKNKKKTKTNATLLCGRNTDVTISNVWMSYDCFYKASQFHLPARWLSGSAWPSVKYVLTVIVLDHYYGFKVFPQL